ncbi:hypothetical protein R7X12_02230 [Mesomycoplasma ovipneumoniae]|uniref:hypothetical protein n=1 Tax=Mesomycoplasma ovipneumoniae TaxID=29562 RepID=UPI0029642163|nr:hypothetical protein [Mesomycoplasma ovipneumoniae]MDW2913543.1 hypothetical protein [Mesomycoplasma ovipneumoniae]MDW2919316.1 hypothetical protein [Mesomycoplasma ovipneumoniae]
MKKFWKIALIVVPVVVVAGTATFLLIYKYRNTKDDGEKSIVVQVPDGLFDPPPTFQPVESSEKINQPEIISSSHNPNIPTNSSKDQPKILLPQPAKKLISETKKDVLVTKFENNINNNSSIPVLNSEKPLNLDNSPTKPLKVVEKVVEPNQKTAKNEEKIETPGTLTSQIVSNQEVELLSEPKIVKTPEVVSQISKVEHKENVQSQPKLENENKVDETKSNSTDLIPVATTESEREVDEIIKNLEEDLKILAHPSKFQNQQNYSQAKKRLYKYIFKTNDQMRIFKERFPKKPITEEEARFLFGFWENNYANFYPQLAKSKKIRENWKKELQKVLTIIKTPKTGSFNRTTGAHVFIFDKNNINNDQWVDAQSVKPTDPKKS